MEIEVDVNDEIDIDTLFPNVEWTKDGIRRRMDAKRYKLKVVHDKKIGLRLF